MGASYIYLPYLSHMIGKRSDFKHVKCETKNRSIRSGFEKCQMSGADPSFTDVLIFEKNKYLDCYYV